MIMTARAIVGGVLGVCISMMSVVQADSGVVEERGTVKLVATLQNSPAFTSVLWKVYRLDGEYREVGSLTRHTGTMNLQPGSYKVVAQLNSKEKSRLFELKSKGKEEVILPMD